MSSSAAPVHGAHSPEHSRDRSLTWLATVATLHCLTGCAIGEVLGLVIGTALGLGNALTIALAITLAFSFGYSLTLLPLRRAGLTLAVALPLALASDTFSITVMEIVDNVAMVTIPGAMDAGLGDWLFWGALALALSVAFVAALPVNRYLIARGRGHAVVHRWHSHTADDPTDSEPPPIPRLRIAAVALAALGFTIAVGVGAATLAGDGKGEPSHRAEAVTAPSALRRDEEHDDLSAASRASSTPE